MGAGLWLPGMQLFGRQRGGAVFWFWCSRPAFRGTGHGLYRAVFRPETAEKQDASVGFLSVLPGASSAFVGFTAVFAVKKSEYPL